MVISGKPPAGAMNSSEILAVGRDHLESVMADKVTIEPETDGRIANLPAKQFSFTFEDNGKSFRERWAVASVNQSRFVQISYTTRADDGKAASRFEHITQTSLLAETELSLPASKDEYIRRNAAELSLDVPRALLAPVTYLFTSQDELINIGLTVDDFSNSDQPRLTPEERIQSWTTDSSKISEPKSSPLVVGEGKGTLVGCTVVTGFEPDITRFARREGVLAFPGLLRISLTGKSSPELEPELDRILSVLINSITLSR